MLHRHFYAFCSFAPGSWRNVRWECCILAKQRVWGEDFANAREVRNFFGSAVVSQADRLYGQTGLSDEDLCRLEESDFKYKER